MFRDESEKVVQKIKSNAVSQVHPQTESPNATEGVVFSALSRRFLNGIDNRGIDFFHTFYVAALDPSVEDPHLWPKRYSSRLFIDAVSSVGLAGLSHVMQDRKMMVAAREKYVFTVKHVTAALDNPKKSNLEEILRAVMLLAVFEASISPPFPVFGC